MSDTEQLPAPQPRKSKKLLILVIALCVAVGAGAYWYKSAQNAAKAAANGKNRPLPVSVAEAKTEDVEVFLSSLGTVTPLNSVTVRSRVDGQLMQVLFREGQIVKAGELLLVIDPRPYQVQLAQAEGQLKRDAALLENARLDLRRYKDLVDHGAIARQTYDTQVSLVHQYEGTVAYDKATSDNARLQISYCRITAPVSGQVGLRQVDPGNMVHASDTTGLLVVNQLAPITVVFTLPEDQLPKVLEKLRAGQKLRVDAYDRAQTRKLAEGELASLDNQIDTTTGTVKLKASFANAKNELYPNQFVNAKLLLEVQKNAIVVPAAAVQRGQQGAYLYVVTQDGVAHTRGVSVGEGGDGLSVILSGLAVGEKVVVDGADRLRDGSSVEIKTPKAKPAEAQNATDANATAQNATGQNATVQTVRPPAATAATPGHGKAAAESNAPKPEAKASPTGDAKTANVKAVNKAQATAHSNATTNATTGAATSAKTDAKTDAKAGGQKKPAQDKAVPASQPPAHDEQAGSAPKA